ncbi:hypothetical protein B9T25_10155 [Acinetobacter sp. ANC 4470]|uniref:hypothetical protein n=1 Tax=Acinetobacter sp. ANC 4470 TaxID=1977881 RepID=UPI000A34A564|nr:hypothetical protein [Acinetobacter sp. ANC 4470]OTG66163.1 hypothetical protein B9T25_10155 [Acinetobacter sp. ANC 4470]
MLKRIKPLLILNTLFFITLTSNAWAKAETETTLKVSYQSFIPKNWKILEKVRGDLNQDDQADIALIIEDTNPDNFVANAGLGSDVLNVNERKLLVLFKQPSGYQLIASNHSLPTEGDAESPCLADPLGESEVLSIQKGVLKIHLHYWLSCGSLYVTNHIYAFRYQEHAFKLIGYDMNNFHRASGDITARSLNFMTDKVKTTTGENEFAESTQPVKAQWSTLKHRYALKLEQVQFNEPHEFE